MWGNAIRKFECVNHAYKCYQGALEKLVQENHSYKGKGGLTLQMRKRLVSAAHCAIRTRSAEPDRKKAVKLLQIDLINGPNHCFGLHHAFSPDFCSTAREAAAAARLVSVTPTTEVTASSSASDSSSYSRASSPRFSVQSSSHAQNYSLHPFHSSYPITSAPSSSGSAAQAPTLSTCPVASAQSVVTQSVQSVQNFPLLVTPVTTSSLETINSSKYSSSISPTDHCFNMHHASSPTICSTPMETPAVRLALISPPTNRFIYIFNFILSAPSNSSYSVSSAPRSSSQSDSQDPNSYSHLTTLASISRSPALAPNPSYPVASSPCFDSQSLCSVQNFSLLATPILLINLSFRALTIFICSFNSSF